MNKVIASAALTASMVGGGFAGAALLGGSALAQDDGDPDSAETDSTETDADSTEAPDRGRRVERFEELAAVVGTDVDTLRDALRDGQTLAEVAESNGVPVQTVIDAIVAQMQERIDEAVAEDRITAEEAAEKASGLEERATEIVNGEAPLGRDHHRGPGCGPGGERLEDLASVLGTDAESLREALRDGQSIADVAEANGADVQAVIDAMIANAEERLDQAVTDGKLTAEEAADKEAEIAERVEDVVNGEAPFGRRGPGGPRGERGERGPGGAGFDGPGADVDGTTFAQPA